MSLRCSAFTSLLVIGFLTGPSTLTVLAQDSRYVESVVEEFSAADTEGFRVVTTRDERQGGTFERSVQESPSINGGSTVLSEVEEQELRIGAETTRRTRREFVTDVNGRQSLVSTLEEDRAVRPDGGERIVRHYTEPDVNGRGRATRREHEETIAEGDGVFTIRLEVSEPSTNGSGLIATERVEQKERRNGAQIVEIDRTTFTNPLGGVTWVAQERRVLTRNYSEGGIRSVESVFRADDAGNLVQSDRIVSREWTGPGGREYRSEEIFSRDVPDGLRAIAPRLSQQVQIAKTNLSTGGWSRTRTVREPRNNRMQVVERSVERARPDGRGGIVIEEETQQLDVNGRLQTLSVRRARESAM
jgi:hypothetical protein